MTYSDLEASVADGRPYHLYLFAEGAQLWRFTSLAEDWTSPPGAADASGSEQTWTASAVSHGPIQQSGDPRRVEVEVTFPVSDTFARRFLGVRGQAVTTLTIYRGHRQVPEETRVVWKGRVIGPRVSGEQIALRCENLLTSVRSIGNAEVYSKICRHVLYGPGCNLDIESFFSGATATAYSGLGVTVGEASGQANGYFAGGVIRHTASGALGFITGHEGAALTLGGRLVDLEGEIDAGGSAAVEIAPGCDLSVATCRDRFSNLPNYGGFPWIPDRNPFGGRSVLE